MTRDKTPMERFTDAMEPFIASLHRESALPEDAEFSLGSIAFQEWRVEIPPRDIEEDLSYAATIAKRYPDPLAALKKIDKAMPIYLKKRAEKRVGSFAQLNGCEARLSAGNDLNLDGLDRRINAYLIGDSTAR